MTILKKDLRFYITLIILSIIYIIPSDMAGILGISDKSIFYNLRILFIACAILILIKGNIRLNKLDALFLFSGFSLLLIRFVVDKTIEFPIIYIMAGAIVATYLRDEIIPNLNKIIIISFFMYTIQCLIFSFYFTDRVMSFVGDPNYTALFLMFFFHYFFIQRKFFLFFLVLMLGIFTYSRAFYLSTFIYLLFNLRFLKHISFFSKFNIISFVSYVFLILFSFYIIFVVFGGYMPDYEFHSGFSRISDVFDRSNWIRFTANVKVIESIDWSFIFFGNLSGTSIDIPEFSEKTIYPHNLFFGLAYNSGFIIAMFYMIILNKNFRKKIDVPYFMSILIFQLFLGFGSFYGLIIPLVVIFSARQYQIKGRVRV